MILREMNETAKNAADGVSVTALLGVLVSALPVVTAIAVLIWSVLRIYDVWLAIKLKHRRLATGEIAAADLEPNDKD